MRKPMKFVALRGDTKKVYDPDLAGKVEEAAEALGVTMVDDLPEGEPHVVGCSPVSWGTSFPEDMVERGECSFCKTEIIYRKGLYPDSYTKLCVPCIITTSNSEVQ